jgi:hypothetical protein
MKLLKMANNCPDLDNFFKPHTLFYLFEMVF